jgi:hypothetical protein
MGNQTRRGARGSCTLAFETRNFKLRTMHAGSFYSFGEVLVSWNVWM